MAEAMDQMFVDWSPFPSLWTSEEDGTSLWLPILTRAGAAPPSFRLLRRRVGYIAVCAVFVLATGKLLCVVLREFQRRRKRRQTNPRTPNNVARTESGFKVQEARMSIPNWLLSVVSFLRSIVR